MTEPPETITTRTWPQFNKKVISIFNHPLAKLNETIMDHNQQAAIIGESSDLFNAIMHFIGYFTLACSFLSIYMILFHSTKHMRVYKYYLLNIAICCGMFDAFTGLIYTPNVLLPAFGVCMAGLWSKHMTNIWFSVAFYIIVVFLMISVSFSITTAFVYRFFLTLGMDQKFQRCRTIVLIVLIYFALVGPVVSLFGYAMLYDPLLTNKLIKEAHPAIYKFSQHKPCIFMSAKLTPKAVIIGTSAVMVINFASMVINLILVFVILRRLKQDKDKFSHTTHAMHRQLTISLAFQFAMPTIFMVLPSMAIDLQILVGQLDDTASLRLCQILIQAMGLHSALNFFVMATMILPYRRAIQEFLVRLCCWYNRRFSHWHTSISEPSVHINSNQQPKIERDQFHLQEEKMFTQRISISDLHFHQIKKSSI